MRLYGLFQCYYGAGVTIVTKGECMDSLDGSLVSLLARLRRIAMPKPPTYLSTLKFLDRKQAAEYIGMSDFWLEKHCNDEQGPRSFRYGRKIWYRREDLDQWIKQRRSLETADDDLWKRSEDRRLSTPPEEKLAEAFKETWGQEETARPGKGSAHENALLALMTSLSPAQRSLLASALHQTPEDDEGNQK